MVHKMVIDKDAEVKYACLICAAHATGFHFGAQSCSACAAFFRRAVALNKQFRCVNNASSNCCAIHYSMQKICRACRYRKCLKAGMNKNCVRSKISENKQRRSYCTKSGMDRCKRFAVQLQILNQLPPDNRRERENSSATNDSANSQPSASTSSSSSSTNLHSSPLPVTDNHSTHEKSLNESECKQDECAHLSPPDCTKPSSLQIRHLKPPKPDYDILQLLIAEEKRIGERRRIMFCERPVASLLGMTASCPFTAEEIRPLRFRDFRRSIRTHILLIYEWLRNWPEYESISKFDQITFLRKCVLYHTILDPCYITLQIGYPDRFVMQNGGYVGTDETSTEGWEDEKEISGITKQRIYRPLLRKMMSEVVTPMLSMNISFEEFVALKAFVSWQGATADMSDEAKPAMRSALDALFRSLHNHYITNNTEVSERLGNIVLLLSSVFATGLKFVESHHEIAFFDLWQLDSLLIQLLKCK